MPRVLKIPEVQKILKVKEKKGGVDKSKVVKSGRRESRKTALEIMLTQKMQVKIKRKETAEARR